MRTGLTSELHKKLVEALALTAALDGAEESRQVALAKAEIHRSGLEAALRTADKHIEALEAEIATLRALQPTDPH